jgi:integrase
VVSGGVQVASIHKRDDKWQIKWRDPDGAQRSRTAPDKKTADRILRDVERVVAEGRKWSPEATVQRVRLTGEGGLIERFLIDAGRSRKPGTMRLLVTRLGMFSDWLIGRTEGDPGPEALSRAALADYYEHLRAAPTPRGARKIGTVRDHLEVVQRFWKWSYENDEDWTGQVPKPRTLADMPDSPRVRTSAPTWEEMDACIAALTTPWIRQLATVMRFTGLRVQQALAVEWADVDLEGGTLHVRPELGKTYAESSGRRIPISPHLVAILSGWGTREGAVVRRPPAGRLREIRRESGRPARPEGAPSCTRPNLPIARAWRRAGVREEVWYGRPDHCFRKGFQSGLKRLGADADAIEYYVGHTLGPVRDAYIDPDSLPMRALADLIPALSGAGAGVPEAFPKVLPLKQISA